jgi:hypothetical protein
LSHADRSSQATLVHAGKAYSDRTKEEIASLTELFPSVSTGQHDTFTRSPYQVHPM